MDIQTIDSQYAQLQTQAQQTIGELQTLAQKLQTASQGTASQGTASQGTASQAGNQDAREWFLDLKSIALAIQAEQNQVANLLGALHNFVAAQVQQMPQQVPQQLPQSVPQTAPWGGQPAYPQQQPYPPQGYYPQQSGGILGSLFNSGFGRAIVTGAGFGIGDDLINKIF